MSERKKAANLAGHSHRSHFGHTASGGARSEIFSALHHEIRRDPLIVCTD
ncbi:hypothetical protein HDG38_003649 [Paraburkholderia sp. WSM4177]|nr:hypothetical protein [Paraburkholderia sp. WSM4177]MBB5483951.1 hypothetical protein [Paraburkholderia sp. WSM4180]